MQRSEKVYNAFKKAFYHSIHFLVELKRERLDLFNTLEWPLPKSPLIDMCNTFLALENEAELKADEIGAAIAGVNARLSSSSANIKIESKDEGNRLAISISCPELTLLEQGAYEAPKDLAFYLNQAE